MHLIENGHKDSLIGQLIRTSYEQLAVETGLPGEIFDWDYEEWKQAITTQLWMTETWKFCSEHGIQVRTGHEQKLQPRRRQDRYLMAEFHARGFKDFQLGRINRCRLYLQVVTIGDIASMNGRNIKIDALEGKRNEYYRRKEIDWPEQPKPSANDWRER